MADPQFLLLRCEPILELPVANGAELVEQDEPVIAVRKEAGTVRQRRRGALGVPAEVRFVTKKDDFDVGRSEAGIEERGEVAFELVTQFMEHSERHFHFVGGLVGDERVGRCMDEMEMRKLFR